MNCRRVQSYLSAYSEGSLPSDIAERLETHLRNCRSCERERLFAEQLLVTAKTLPAKSVAEDFNLKLMNRVYAEQSRPTESYLPVEEPSLLRRPLGWGSALATIAVAAVLTVVFFSNRRANEPLQLKAPSFTQTQEGNTSLASATSGTRYRHGEPSNVYDYVIGVNGATSNYRATDVSHVRSLRLADAKIESLYVEALKKLGSERMANAAQFLRYSDGRYYRVPPVNSRYANTNLMRNASATY